MVVNVQVYRTSWRAHFPFCQEGFYYKSKCSQDSAPPMPGWNVWSATRYNRENLCRGVSQINLDTSLLRESFARIGEQKAAFAETFYATLLEKYPDMRSFFAGVDLKRQQTSLIATLLAMLNGAERGEEIREQFQRLGQRHHARQIGAEYYPAFGQTLLETLARYDPAWTPELRSAWAAALEQCVRYMMESYHPEATLYRVQISRTRPTRTTDGAISSR